MTSVYVGLIGVIVLLAFMLLLRLPIAVSMGLVGFLGFSYLVSFKAALGMASSEIFTTFSDYYLGAVIMFILMGYLSYHTGLSNDIYDALRVLIGHVRGGIAIATIGASAVFGAICGSTIATTASMGTLSLPEMDKLKYHPGLSSAAVAAGGILGTMIPPSIPAIAYGIYTETSIKAVFLGLIAPGIILAIALSLTVVILTIRDPNIAPRGAKTTFREKIQVLYSSGIVEVAILMVAVLGGLFAGIFTPTESGAIGAFCVLVISIARRKFNNKVFVTSLFETGKTSAMVFIILAGANIFGTFSSVSRLPATITAGVSDMGIHPIFIILLVFLVQIIFGFFMDGIAVLMLTLPICFPIITGLGYDPVWLGPLLVLIAGLGMITPPVGICLFIVHDIYKGKVGYPIIFKGIAPFVFSILITLFILTVYPSITTFLPNLLR